MIKKLLIVHNRTAFIDTAKSVLNRAGIKIFTAASGEEALNIHTHENVDLIISDLEMPGISGDKLCSMIRRDEKLKRVSIIIVCSSSQSDIERVERCKANSYVTKPVRPEQLLDKVTQLVDIPERKSYRVLLKISVNGKSANGSFFCSSKDISSTGILLQTDRTFAIGDVVSCEFFLPNSLHVSADAEIMRVTRNGDNTFHCGARYVNLSQEHRSAIEKFINGRSARS